MGEGEVEGVGEGEGLGRGLELRPRAQAWTQAMARLNLAAHRRSVHIYTCAYVDTYIGASVHMHMYAYDVGRL